MENGNTVKEELKRHASILADCIIEELDSVYDSYTPTVYKRTYGLYNSVYIDNGIKIDVSNKGIAISLGLHFDDGAIHESFSGEDANTAVLLNEGWSWKKTTVDIPYFSRREGTHFIEKGIEKYKQRVNNPFAIRLTINNEERIF